MYAPSSGGSVGSIGSIGTIQGPNYDGAIASLSSSISSTNDTVAILQASSSQWVTSGSDIYYSAGRVGIGTTTPWTNLTVNGDTSSRRYYLDGQLFAVATTTNNFYLAGALPASAPVTGSNNFFAGNQAGNSNTSGNDNIFMGNQAGFANVGGLSNIFLGSNAGINNVSGSSNIFLGTSAGSSNTGSNNIFLGSSAGSTNNGGLLNVYIGSSAGAQNNAGFSNVAIGYQSGQGSGTGNSANTLVGYQSGIALTSGSNNVLLGHRVGTTTTTGANNILIGSVLARSASDSNYLNIGNAIYGNLSTGNIGIGTTTPITALHVASSSSGKEVVFFANTNTGSGDEVLHLGVGGATAGTSNLFIAFFQGSTVGNKGTRIGYIQGSGSNSVTYNTTSDLRLKENVVDTQYGLQDLLKIHVKDYNFINSPGHTVQGFIAQDLEKVYPYAVARGKDDGVSPLEPNAVPWGVDYGRITPLLVKSIQDLNLKLENLIASPASVSGNGLLDNLISSIIGKFTKVETDTIEIKTGLEIKDEVTGKVYCVKISNGEWKKIEGVCSNVNGASNIPSNAQNSSAENTQTPTGTTTQEVVTPTSTSTPVVPEESNATSIQSPTNEGSVDQPVAPVVESPAENQPTP